MPRFSIRRLRLVALALLLPLSAAAQDRPDRDPVARLTDALDLTGAQAELVGRHLGDGPEPGALWRVAADLAPTLSEAQRDALLTKPDRPRARGERDGRRGHHGRHERPDGPRGERPTEEERAARREAAHAAMQEALDLTAEQAEALEALQKQHRAARAERRADRQAERPAPGAVPDALEEILTADQQAVWQVHHALAHRLRLHPGRSDGRGARG